LFLETVEGDAPRLQGKVIEGGWPCRRYPEDWKARAQQLLDDDSRARAAHGLCGKSDRPRENYPRLRGHLQQALSGSLTGRDVGMIRKILASVNEKRGLPGSPELAELRQRQSRQASLPTSQDFSAVLLQRLSGKPVDEGLSTIDELTGAVTADEG